jgi:hypothetical protein
MIINKTHEEEIPFSSLDFAYMLREYIFRYGYLHIGFGTIEVYRIETQYQEQLPKIVTGLIFDALNIIGYATEELTSVYRKTQNTFWLMPFTLVKKETQGLHIPKDMHSINPYPQEIEYPPEES